MQLSYWFWLGTIYIIIMTWQDYKNNMKIDDRLNYFMLGSTVSIISHVKNTLLYQLALAIVLAGLYVLIRRIKPLGEGDINTFSWVFLGYGLVSPFHLGVWSGVFCLTTVIYLLLKNYLFKYTQPIQFYGVILTAWVLTGFLLGMVI